MKFVEYMKFVDPLNLIKTPLKKFKRVNLNKWIIYFKSLMC